MEVCRLLSWQNLSFYFVLNLDTEPIFRKLVLLPYCLNNSNTSHVPIYHNRLCFHKHYVAQFKYISYSYLSRGLQFKIQPLVQFKYISCSYLSQIFVRNAACKIPFKYISCSYLSRQCKNGYGGNQIQIHLMFLFISSGKETDSNMKLFKYISCSYLSFACLHNAFPVFSFKYISCSYLSLQGALYKKFQE